MGWIQAGAPLNCANVLILRNRMAVSIIPALGIATIVLAPVRIRLDLKLSTAKQPKSALLGEAALGIPIPVPANAPPILIWETTATAIVITVNGQEAAVLVA